MQYKCNECNDTGSLDKSGQWLNCVSCEVATDRAALEAFIEKLPAMGEQEQAWRIHQRALAMAPKQEAPAGWKLVPEDPTGDMFRAAAKIDNEMFAGGSSHGAEDGQVWAAMYDAAPEAPIAAPAAANGAEDIKDMAQARRVITQLRAAAGPDAALTDGQVHQGVMALLGCTSSDVEDYSAKMYEGYANYVRRVHAALSGAKGN